MPEQICSGIFYDHCFLSVSIVKILYKAEATNPEARARKNATQDIKGGIKGGGGVEMVNAAPQDMTLRDIALLGVAPPDITLPYITLLRTSYYSTFHRLT